MSQPLTVYAYPRCGTCRKALKFLEEHDLAYEMIDIVDEPPSKEQLKKLIDKSGVDLKKFFNTSGKKYREFNMKEKVKQLSDEELISLLAGEGMLIKRPIITDGEQVTVGFNEDTFKRIWLSQ